MFALFVFNRDNTSKIRALLREELSKFLSSYEIRVYSLLNQKAGACEGLDKGTQPLSIPLRDAETKSLTERELGPRGHTHPDFTSPDLRMC